MPPTRRRTKPKKAMPIKNRRRIIAAETALRRVVKTPQNRPRLRLGSSFTEHPMMRHARRYIDSVTHDVLLQDVCLPTMQHTGPYARLHLQYRYRPSYDNNGGFVFVCAPYLLPFTDFLYVTRNQSATSVLNDIPTAMTGNSTALVVPSTSGAAIQRIMNGMLTTSSGTTAQVFRTRCHGVQYMVDYIGPNSDKGGSIFCFHNGQDYPLIQQNVTATSSFASPFTSTALLSGAYQLCSEHYLGQKFRHVWRPTDAEFREGATYQANMLADTLTTDIAFCPDATPYAPYNNATVPSTNKPVPLGWTSAIYCQPAEVGTAGQIANYYVTVDAYVDCFYTGQVNTNPGSSVQPATQPAISHPEAAAMVNNALGNLHQTRATNVAHLSADNTGVDAFLRQATSTVSKTVSRLGKESIQATIGQLFN